MNLPIQRNSFQAYKNKIQNKNKTMKNICNITKDVIYIYSIYIFKNDGWKKDCKWQFKEE